tara:strand:+ start:934 stop:1308 length:375 start_codon:yes stop_codon:yes gene_type:complete
MDKNSTIDFWDAIDKLLIGIKKDYAGWGSDIDSLDESSKKIRLKMIDEFNQGINIKIGRKYIKVIQGSSVWGFIAAGDGSLKGIPHKKGDVFKAAGWRAPAKWARGSIFSKDKFYSWTGPNYLI